jgi:hypothetical protein
MKKISRRNFVESSSALLASTGLVTAEINLETPLNLKTMFIHHVYFWMKDANSTESKARLLKGLKTLSTIKLIHAAHIGVPASTNREVIDRTYQFSLLLIFKTKADQDAYQTDPTHLKFVEECSSLWTKVIVYDSVDA